jgi:hypothetical protein
MSGGSGEDGMYEGIGAETVNGGGNDAVYGGRDDDAANGGMGEELLAEDEGNDTANADTGGDSAQAVDDQKDRVNLAGSRDEVYYDKALRRCGAARSAIVGRFFGARCIPR